MFIAPVAKNLSEPRRGDMCRLFVGKIKDVFLIEFDIELLKQGKVFVLKRTAPVVLLLILDVANDGREL